MSLPQNHRSFRPANPVQPRFRDALHKAAQARAREIGVAIFPADLSEGMATPDRPLL
jgi:hypothetical protein